ncbi:MAG: CDP-alcohol phosphatidyltransferase family protein [Methyloligellaceae bacterium]
MYIPNIISVFRIFLVPLVVWLIISNEMQLAFIVFLLAGISDGVDGYIAKQFNWTTELGAYLDPIADKALLVSIYVSLGYYEYLPAWLVIMVVSRDFLIVGAIMLSWMLERPVQMQPLPVSKVNTVGQIVLAALVLFTQGFGLGFSLLTTVVVWVVGALTVASAVAYLLTWLQHMSVYDQDNRLESQELETPGYGVLDAQETAGSQKSDRGHSDKQGAQVSKQEGPSISESPRQQFSNREIPTPENSSRET